MNVFDKAVSAHTVQDGHYSNLSEVRYMIWHALIFKHPKDVLCRTGTSLHRSEAASFLLHLKSADRLLTASKGGLLQWLTSTRDSLLTALSPECNFALP